MQLLYLGLLAVLLVGGASSVVRQILRQRQMDERSKELGELIRTGDAVSEDYYELGVVLTKKKLFTQALKNYTKAIKLWEGDETELAEVRSEYMNVLQYEVHVQATLWRVMRLSWQRCFLGTNLRTVWHACACIVLEGDETELAEVPSMYMDIALTASVWSVSADHAVSSAAARCAKGCCCR